MINSIFKLKNILNKSNNENTVKGIVELGRSFSLLPRMLDKFTLGIKYFN